MSLGERHDVEFVFAQARMHLHELFEVGEQLVDADARRALAGFFAQDVQIAPGNLDAIRGLPRYDVEPALDELKVLHLHLRVAVDPLVQHMHKTGK